MSYYKDKTVLCTGGCGFIGSNLVHRLVKEGAKVIVFDDLTTGDFDNLKGLEYTCALGSVYDRNILNIWMSKADIVFHLAARNIICSTKNPIEDFETNIGGTLNVLMAARSVNIERVIYTSSASVYGNPKYLPINEDDNINLLTPYAVSKYAGEGYCMAFHESYGLSVAVLRLSNVYGTYQSPKNPYCGVVAKFMSNALNNNVIEIHGDGLSTRDFTYVDDVVDALLIAGSSLRAEGEVFNVATGIETSSLQLAKEIVDITNTDSYISNIDRRDIDNIRRRVLNIEKIRRKLGWTPKTTLIKGLELTRNWLTS